MAVFLHVNNTYVVNLPNFMGYKPSFIVVSKEYKPKYNTQ